jgi:hypothetical protein
MANEILSKPKTLVTATCTLTSLANGAGRICALIDNTTTKAGRIIVSLRFKTGGSAPTANSVVKVYLIRTAGDTAQGQQGGQYAGSLPGTADAALSTEPINSPCPLAIQVGTGTAQFYSDSSELIIEPGAKYSFVVWNAIGQALSSTASDHVLEITPFVDEIQ